MVVQLGVMRAVFCISRFYILASAYRQGRGWGLYRGAAMGLEVLPSVDEAVEWADELIGRITGV